MGGGMQVGADATTPAPAPRVLAYFVNEYPAPSHTFIRREIRALEARGWTIHRFSIRRGRSLTDREDLRELPLTEALLPLSPLDCLAGLLLALRTPRRVWSALRAGSQMASRSTRGFARSISCVPYALVLLKRLRSLGVRHVHGHFGTNSAAVVRVLHALGGPTYSFTVHGPSELEPPSAWSTREKVSDACFVVGISQFTKDKILAVTPAEHRHKVHLVRVGLELDGRPAPPVPIPAEPRILCVARLSEEKGLLVLVGAIARVRARGVDVQLDILGEGPMRAVLEKEIERLALGACVRLRGWVDEAGIEAALATSRGLVLASFAEGLPVVLMESFRAARPVVATRVGGVAELVEPGVSGWLVPPHDEEALAQAIQALLEAPVERLDAMGRAGRAAVREKHDVATECEKLARLYDDALADPAG